MEQDALEKIYDILAQVADLQYAIDAGEGDVFMHSQRLSKMDHRLRRLARTIPDEVFIRLPTFAAFTLTAAPIQDCWNDCRTEVELALSGDLPG